MPLQQRDLLFAQHQRRLLCQALETEQSLVPRLDLVAQPHAAHADALMLTLVKRRSFAMRRVVVCRPL